MIISLLCSFSKYIFFKPSEMASIKPPFTFESATQKVKVAQDLWNTTYVVIEPELLYF